MAGTIANLPYYKHSYEFVDARRSPYWARRIEMAGEVQPYVLPLKMAYGEYRKIRNVHVDFNHCADEGNLIVKREMLRRGSSSKVEEIDHEQIFTRMLDEELKEMDMVFVPECECSPSCVGLVRAGYRRAKRSVSLCSFCGRCPHAVKDVIEGTVIRNHREGKVCVEEVWERG